MSDGYWSVSAQYRVPSGEMSGYIRLHIRCAESELEAEVLRHIKNNPARKFAGDLQLYDKSFTPYTEKELAKMSKPTPKVVRVVETYVLKSGRRLREEMERIAVNQGLGGSKSFFYEGILRPFARIKGMVRTAINESGDFRYSIETSKGTKEGHERIHQKVQEICQVALRYLEDRTI